jgi:hypothetical protein
MRWYGKMARPKESTEISKACYLPLGYDQAVKKD